MGEPPAPGIPVVLQEEFARALVEHPALTPEALLAEAQQAGLDAASPSPLCIANRRATDGHGKQQVFFAIFDPPAFRQFRQHLAAQWNGGITPKVFDPTLLSPALIIATVESTDESWLPLGPNSKVDCIAPITISVGEPVNLRYRRSGRALLSFVPVMLPPQVGAPTRESGDDPELPVELRRTGLNYSLQAKMCVSKIGTVEAYRIDAG